MDLLRLNDNFKGYFMAKVLVVDDARVMRFHITKLLKELGHTVTAEAKDGFEAVEAYKKITPDLVTMDVEMPTSHDIVGGIGAVEELIKLDPNVIIIMISSQTDRDHISEALKKGAKNFINKPITAEKLYNMIKHLDL